MLKFTVLDQQYPDKRPPAARRSDFAEIHAPFDAQAGADQAARCAQCGVPFCQTGCPLGNDIPDWLMLAGEGRMREAYQRVSATSTMPEICGRICPQDRLCEGACVIQRAGHGAVTIGAVETHITETAWNQGWIQPMRPARETGFSVGIVGSGPAGLSAAERLREQGHTVTVYDRHDRAGGLLIYGIPNFKLDKSVVARRVERLTEGGIRLRLGFEVGRDAGLDELRAEHDAVFIATGTYRARALSCPGSGGRALVPALDYLIASNRKGFDESVAAFDDGRLNAHDRRVAVIGGGDTAMDCVRTAVRQGARSVICTYRRDRDNMPGSAREVAHAIEEGVQFEWLAAPAAILGDLDHARGVRARRMRLSDPDAGGRRTPVPIEGENFDLEADMVITALGFMAEALPEHFDAPALTLTASGTVQTCGRGRTSIPGVYAGGDIVRGASLVVWAIRDGQIAAETIHTDLMQQRQEAAA